MQSVAMIVASFVLWGVVWAVSRCHSLLCSDFPMSLFSTEG
jgi:hypothetical protein